MIYEITSNEITSKTRINQIDHQLHFFCQFNVDNAISFQFLKNDDLLMIYCLQVND